MLERRSSVPQGNARLAERRRIRRRRIAIALGMLLVSVLGALIWGLRQSAVRITNVLVYGANASFVDYAKSEMRGNYLGIIPRDSIFFFPASNIRAHILTASPSTAAVSIFRNGLTGISIKTNERIAIARWCGSTDSKSSLQASSPQVVSTSSTQTLCYVFDASGYIFTLATTTTETVNTFSLYAPLKDDVYNPLHATIRYVEKLPHVFDFARQLDTFGSPTIEVVIRNDEVDDYLASGTRVTYVLGHEQDAFTALVSARSTFNLANASIDYIDLRFDGKIYIKKKK